VFIVPLIQDNRTVTPDINFVIYIWNGSIPTEVDYRVGIIWVCGFGVK